LNGSETIVPVKYKDRKQMKQARLIAPFLLAGLIGCAEQAEDQAGNEAANMAVANNMSVAAEPPPEPVTGPWGSLRNSVSQYPRDIALFDRSVISDDLQALLGDDFEAFEANMEVQGPLQEDRLLYVVGNKANQGGTDAAYLLIEPVTRRLEVGLWQGGEFTAYTSPGEPLYKPQDVRTMIDNNGQAPAAPERAERCREELNLSPGTTVERTSTITGYDYCEYDVLAQEGQTITTILEGAPSLDVVVYGQDSPELTDGEAFTVPADGVYPLRVLQPRAIARRDDGPKEFTLKVTVE
jgi:hypothetical protein